MSYKEERSPEQIREDYELRGISIDPDTGLQREPGPPVKPKAVLVMTKVGPNGEVLRRDDGKILKGPHFEPPVISRILQRHIR